MPMRKFNPVTPGRRQMTVLTFDEITTDTPHAPLTEKLQQSGGRSSTGEQTIWWRGGGHKRLYRVIDFKRDKAGIPGKVSTIEYDPNRSARIALVTYADGEKRYILQPVGLKVGDTVSAGAGVQVVAKEGDYVSVKMPSGEIRKIYQDCLATIGQVGNIDHENVSIGKAGRSRWLGKRPHVRGVAMNPVDHPLGGGEGKTSGGRHPVSPWGTPTKGYKTRNKKSTDRFIVTRRRK